MANLSAHQKAHILQQDLSAFIDTLMADIRERRRQLADDETLRRKIKVGIGRARKNGLHTDDQLWEYVRIMFETSPNFDQEPRIRKMLDDTSLSVDDRWEALFEERFDDAWESTPTNTAASASSSTGTAKASTTRSPPPGSASLPPGPAAISVSSPSRASARKCWCNSWMATPTGR